MAKKLRIRQKRSFIGREKSQKLTIKALGIKKTYQEVIKEDTPQIRGMIAKVTHLLEVVELEE